MNTYQKTGYLTENFRYFHLQTTSRQDFHYHYHEFYKILFFLKGDVIYHIEGRAFHLLPGDIILIPAEEIHCPQLQSDTCYERQILYLSSTFLKSFQNSDLSLCFTNARKRQSYVMRIPSFYQKHIWDILLCLEDEIKENSLYAGKLYQETLVSQLLILLNRAALNQQSIYPDNTCQNEKILLILDYINKHLSDNLTIDSLSERFFISRYHLMHLFKASTGYTVGNYITIKRLFFAKALIQSGTPVTEACYLSGFQNYSTFSRAYKKHFHTNAKNREFSNGHSGNSVVE